MEPRKPKNNYEAVESSNNVELDTPSIENFETEKLVMIRALCKKRRNKRKIRGKNF